MDLALKQAEIAETAGEVPIGCVIVRGGTVIAQAGNRTLTDRDPTAHAEILAIREAARVTGSERLTDCDLYVTLEPCSHHGRTPPCAAAVIRAGIRQVVCGTRDPNPLVAGRGEDRLCCRSSRTRRALRGGDRCRCGRAGLRVLRDLAR